MASSIKRKAKEFMVWRAGQSVDWQCSHQDIADETGISPSYVSIICRAKGWHTMPDDDENTASFSGRVAIDHAMSTTDARFLGRV